MGCFVRKRIFMLALLGMGSLVFFLKAEGMEMRNCFRKVFFSLKRDGSGPNPNCPLKRGSGKTSSTGRILKRDGMGPFKDGRGPRRSELGPKEDCPLKEESDKINNERQDSGRILKRDGTGPFKDGRGPRESELGPKEDCPKKK